MILFTAPTKKAASNNGLPPPRLLESLSKEKSRKSRAESDIQAERNRKARNSSAGEKMDMSLIAKMDSSKSDNFKVLGQFWLVPVIAKMDALKVNIIKIPICYP